MLVSSGITKRCACLPSLSVDSIDRPCFVSCEAQSSSDRAILVKSVDLEMPSLFSNSFRKLESIATLTSVFLGWLAISLLQFLSINCPIILDKIWPNKVLQPIPTAFPVNCTRPQAAPATSTSWTVTQVSHALAKTSTQTFELAANSNVSRTVRPAKRLRSMSLRSVQ